MGDWRSGLGAEIDRSKKIDGSFREGKDPFQRETRRQMYSAGKTRNVKGIWLGWALCMV